MAITEVLSMFVVHVIETLGYFGVFIMMTLESACIPFPSEVIMPFAGFVVQEGQLSFLGIVVIGTLGNLVGSLIAYFVGLKGGAAFGEMSERFKELVLKTSDTAMCRGFESHSLRHFLSFISAQPTCGSTQVAEGAPLLRE